MRLLAFLFLVTSALAALSNSFCSEDLKNMVIPPPPGDSILTYTASSVCLTFGSTYNFTLTVAGTVYKGGTVSYSTTSWCQGNYELASPANIDFSFPQSAPSYCTQIPAGFGFCNWNCLNFAGPWKIYVNDATTTTQITINGDPSTPGNWGKLPQSIPLNCNSTCGSFAGMVPSGSGGNQTYKVRRWREACFNRCDRGALELCCDT